MHEKRSPPNYMVGFLYLGMPGKSNKDLFLEESFEISSEFVYKYAQYKNRLVEYSAGLFYRLQE